MNKKVYFNVNWTRIGFNSNGKYTANTKYGTKEYNNSAKQKEQNKNSFILNMYAKKKER